MTDHKEAHLSVADRSPKAARPRRGTEKRKRARVMLAVWIGIFLLFAGAAVCWLILKTNDARQELQAATSLLPKLKDEVLRSDPAAATQTVDDLQKHTAAARRTTDDPLWKLASAVPWVGGNFRAVSEVSITADDVASLAAKPLVGVLDSLDWKALAPEGGGIDTTPVSEASPVLVSAANAVQQSSERLNGIDSTYLMPEVSGPLKQAREQLGALRSGLQAAADFSSLAPNMLGEDRPKHYLVLVQNNAESRATGGIPGALAILSANKGHISLDSQSSATQLGAFTPAIAVDSEQQVIYSSRLGKYMQDVNLTPDFPSAAKNAQAMWERSLNQHVDGVISIDPIALGYILDATGPVKISDPDLVRTIGKSLPIELTGKNVVKTLLSDVYSKVAKPELQDVYFAGVAKEVFSALSSGAADDKTLIEGIGKGVTERRILVWSDTADEQRVIERYPLGGSISGPSVGAAEFGVYFNDGTGAKMDYYVKRTVQVVRQCPSDGYEEMKVRVSSTNTAPADAAATLPIYVTGSGSYGVPTGSVQTNVVAYGPTQANVESAVVDGQKTPFAPYIHANRPVGVVAQVLAPGETKTVEFTFGKIVQHAEPNVVVTPTVQHVKDVILPAENASCDQGQ